MKTSVTGYPRIGENRELKFASEKYFKHDITADELNAVASSLRVRDWKKQQENLVDFIPSNTFSFYDNILDTAVMLNIIPERYRNLGLGEIDEYFAMARGYQGKNGDVKALAMKKWFNTNYHYLVPEIDDDTQIKLSGTKPFDEFSEAKENGINTKPVIIGPFTFLKLSRFVGTKSVSDVIPEILSAYIELLEKFGGLSSNWIQFDEPSLVMDLTEDDINLFTSLYEEILKNKGNVKILLQTYFGDVRDSYDKIISLDFDGIGIDFIEGENTLQLVKENGLPADKLLFAGVVNGKNIWRNNYTDTAAIINELKGFCEIVISTSCSLLHVPYSLNNETVLSENYIRHFAFAEEKLNELLDLKIILSSDKYADSILLKSNAALFTQGRDCENKSVQEKVLRLSDEDFIRLPDFTERERIQKTVFNLPLLPTTTIGSFPQTAKVKANRSAFRKGKITEDEYTVFNKEEIAECIALQENIGLDVLVHGEFERNDMVEYFGECLDGYIFTEKAWVQSYGTRCVKPPIVWGDISRSKPMTVKWSVYAQSLTEKPMKGMLTGPVTILNWSFPREDISLKECVYQLALAIREEVLDLEANGIKIIQIDEAALREKLPLRKSDWNMRYLDWAIPAFRYVHSGVKPETQIHTHMCYSEFADIIGEIDDMDADVITFEASRSDLAILDVLKSSNFKTAVGPGVYDIHSPRVPAVEEIKDALSKMVDRIPKDKLWVNPDCGLKTRGTEETEASLRNLVQAAKGVRVEIS